MTLTGIVYIMNFPTGESYIGSRYGKDLTLDKYKTSSKYVQDVAKEFGKEFWDLTKKTILERIYDGTPEDTCKVERKWQTIFDVKECSLFLNRSLAGDYFHNIGINYWTGKKHSQESRQKMSESGKKKVFTAEHRANLCKARAGRKHSEATRKKMSETHLKNNRKREEIL